MEQLKKLKTIIEKRINEAVYYQQKYRDMGLSPSAFFVMEETYRSCLLYVESMIVEKKEEMQRQQSDYIPPPVVV